MTTEGAPNAIGPERLDPLFQLLASKDRELSEKRGADMRALRAMTWGAILLGVLGLSLYAAQSGSRALFVQILAVGLLASGTAALGGTLLGVLFGVPHPGASVVATAPEERSSSGVSEVVRTSTNLEQIADWLIKILIGAGLTQVHALPGALKQLSAWLGASLPGRPEAGNVVLGAVVYCLALGVLFGYVWTRVVLSPMLRRTDEQLRRALAQVSAAELTASRAQGELQRAEHTAVATLERARADAESLLLDARRGLEKLEQTQKRMLEHLYDPPDRRGYEQTIRIADEYVKARGEPDSFIFFLRYASAEGQRAAYDPERYDEARAAALQASRKVVEQSPELGRYWLSLLWHPEHPEGTPSENDLQIFFDDPEFKALIGKDPYVLPK